MSSESLNALAPQSVPCEARGNNFTAFSIKTFLAIAVLFVIAPLTQAQVVISEFRTCGTAGGNDEFVEIYNNTDTAIDISGFLLNRSSSSGTTGFTLATIPANTLIGARGHYLIGNISYSGIPAADLTYTSPTDATTMQPDGGIPDSGGIALIQSDGTTIADQVGTSTGSLYQEAANGGTVLLQPNTSFERKRGGRNIQDTGNNAADFQVLSPSQPQSSISPTATGSTIAGRVMTAGGAPLAGVQVSLRDNSTGVVRRTATDRAGLYIFTEVETNSLFTVTALQREATFSNPSQTFTATGDMVEVNFIGEARKGRAFSRTPRGK